MSRQKKYFNSFNTTWLVMFLLAIFTWQCKKDPLKGEVGTCPSILSTDPSSGDTNVVTSIKITAIFNEAMDAATVNETTFVLYQGANQVSGTVTYSGNTATFTPAGYLAINTYYTATVTTGTQDPYGNALPANYVWSFKTVSYTHLTLPTNREV